MIELQSYGGRKFLLTLLSTVGSIALVAWGKISGDVYSVVQIASLAAYGASNVIEKMTEAQAAANPTKEKPDGPT